MIMTLRTTLSYLILMAGPIWGIAQQTIEATLLHDGLERTYILYVPASYTGDESVPLVFNFHGYSSNANDQMGYGDFRSIADTAGFLLVHPQGTLLNGISHWNVGGWTTGSTVDDVGFTAALIDAIASQYAIDRDRVYATGMSNGGFMSFQLACQLSEQIAAIASVTGSMTPEIYDQCDPQHPMPVLQIHGTFDFVVPYNGTTWTKSIEETLQYWVAFNQCEEVPITSTLPNTNILDGSTVDQFVYPDGNQGLSTVHYRVNGGGHTWPGTWISLPGTNQDFDASLEIWRFFSQYDINGLIVPSHQTEVVGTNQEIKLFPNPTKGLIWIEGAESDHMLVALYSLTGQPLISDLKTIPDTPIDLTHLPAGVYFLRLGDQVFKVIKAQ
ncbi:MAG TPA: PHB depolymerase family esterase [Saprospiraceae bacterium]|nr:PHB depolymerase family esterase [Saprospiraceae bacterium]HMQ85505.1 PHB depolymerase family esterase [Saprospiraceae bacterium]